MAVKYLIEYKDTQNISYKINIKSDSYTGLPIEVGGYAIIDRPEIDEIYTVIRGSSITIKLEASTSVTFEDLYSENEKEYTVELYRSGNIKFVGYIDPSGLFEDLVNDKWEISLRCVDGLGLLDNLSYVDDNELPYTGKLSDIEVIYNCLRRTGLYQPNGDEIVIESSINTMYTFADNENGPLSNVNSNQERFYKDDGETIQSCKEVLESTLKKYGGAIVQDNGRWKIFSFYELLAPTRPFYYYKGVGTSWIADSNYTTQAIGSQINDAPIHWCNENQRKEISPSVGAVKVNYKYGFVKSIFDNINFLHDGTTIDDWTILNSGLIQLGAQGRYIIIESDSANQNVIESDAVSLLENNTLEINIQYSASDSSSAQKTFEFKFQLVLTDGVTTYYFNQGGEWVTSSATAKFVNGFALNGSFSNTLTTGPLPIAGDFKIILKQATIAELVSGVNRNIDVVITEVSVAAVADKSIQGENHTYQIDGNSTRVEDIIEVGVGDNFGDIYLGALYKNDEDTNTDTWNTIYTPSDIVNNQSILQILSEYVALHKRQPLYVISGDAFGYFDYMQLYTFDLIPDRTFMITAYNFNTKTNVGAYTFLELTRGSTFGLTYSFSLDYGNVVKPTIVG